ncbi:hypothetical protein L2D14_18435 [Thalassospiraceae bacterium LMO-JJ14]|nr:hypothetical protein L2D14_18435 [Thalassospiraceae bacterium LMO-JJ14]
MPDFTTYVGYFIGGSGQVPVIFGTIAVLAGLAAMGRVIYRGNGLAEADLFGGWALAVLVFTVGNVFFRIPFNYMFWLLAAFGGGAMVWFVIREHRIGPGGFWRVLLLGAPLLLIASARMASEWDEFSHWLPTTRYIYDAHQFPFGREVSGGYFPGYPYAWLFLVYMADMLAGQLIEAAGSTLNILLLLVFGVGAVRMWCDATENPMPDAGKLTWTGALFAVLAATLLNPTFVQKVIMTTYADASTSVAVGVGTVLAYFILDALSRQDDEKARSLAWQFGMAMAVLINIKQSNLVLVVMLLGGACLVVLRDRSLAIGPFVKLLPRMVLPAVLIYGVWRYHVSVNLPHDAEALFQPFDAWNTHILWPILKQMFVVAGKKSAYFGLMGVAVVFACIAFYRVRGSFDRLAMLIGFSFLGYNAFLYLIFVAQFGANDALRVASYWRYNHHLGLMAVIFGAYGAGTLWRKYMSGRQLHGAVLKVLFCIVFLAPFIFAEKLRFDLEHPKPFYRSVGRELPDLMQVGGRLLILDPNGTGESGVLTLYALAERRNEFLGYFAAYHDFSVPAITQVVEKMKPTYVLVHSIKPVVNEVLGTKLPEKGFSYLLRKTGDAPGKWEIVKKWPRSDGHWAGR